MKWGDNMRVLVVAAHPDDETLGAGGAIARLAGEENEVNVAILCMRNKSVKYGWQKAKKILGVNPKDYTRDWLSDNQFDASTLLTIVFEVESIITDCRPDIIYTHSLHDLNIDHQLTARAVLTATRPMKGQTVKEVYSFEVPSSTEWGFNYGFKPNVFVDISSTLEKKLEAMRCYKTEVREWPHPRSPEALTAIAKRWGSVAGCDAAEAFELVRKII